MADPDDAFHGLERRFIALQAEHEKVKKDRDELQQKLTEATEENAQDKAKIAELRQV